MDSKLYEQHVEELNRKLLFHRSHILKKEYKRYHITDTQYMVLSFIDQHPKTTIGAVAKALHMDAGNTSSLCKKLEKAGYLYRKKSDRDERIVELSTSDTGSRCVVVIAQKLQEHYEAQWDQYNCKDKEMILNGLEKLNQFLDSITKKEKMIR